MFLKDKRRKPGGPSRDAPGSLLTQAGGWNPYSTATMAKNDPATAPERGSTRET